MARTFRRKNYEESNNTSWDRKGRKTAGFYTEYDFMEAEDGSSIYGWKIYREPTKKEFFKAWYWAHKDCGRDRHSPSRHYRNARMRENRSINKEELIKFVKNENYEPLFENNPRSCLWDWR